MEQNKQRLFSRNYFLRWLLARKKQVIWFSGNKWGNKIWKRATSTKIFFSSQHSSRRVQAAAPWLRPFSTSQPAMQTMSRSTPSGRCSSTTSSWTSSSSSTLMASRMRMGGTALLWRVSRLRNSASSSSLPFSKRAFWREESRRRLSLDYFELCKAAVRPQFQSVESLWTAQSSSSPKQYQANY